MTNILEYQPIIDAIDHSLFIKGNIDGDSKDPYVYYSLDIKVRPSFEFCAESRFSLLKSMIKNNIDDFEKMHKETKGNTSIYCQEWGSNIKFALGTHGDMMISGQLNSTQTPNTSMTFELKSDQTIIPYIVTILKRLISK